MPSLIVATRNDHKLRELAEILDGFELIPLPEEVELPPEDAPDFAGNAAIKARAAFEATGQPAFGDDSGLEVNALGGRPGVHSARYAGPDATDEENLAKLLDELPPGGGRRAAFVCWIAFADDAGRTYLFEGVCRGRLIETPRGEGGFGYDPVFVPDDTGPEDERTMSELSPEEKNSLSHRGRAARRLAAHLAQESS
jgi:XTP/dITP diphosphohydrolase